VTYWLDGNTATYRNYYSGEPDDAESCFYIKGDSDGQFYDDKCDSDCYYICKITSPPGRLHEQLSEASVFE